MTFAQPVPWHMPSLPPIAQGKFLGVAGEFG